MALLLQFLLNTLPGIVDKDTMSGGALAFSCGVIGWFRD